MYEEEIKLGEEGGTTFKRYKVFPSVIVMVIIDHLLYSAILCS